MWGAPARRMMLVTGKEAGMNTREITGAVRRPGTGFQAGLFVAAGTALHHVVDSGISLAVFRLVLPVLRPQGAHGS